MIRGVIAVCLMAAGAFAMLEELDPTGLYTQQYWHDQAQAFLPTQEAKVWPADIRAKNAIFFMGDGMGVTATTLGRMYINQQEGRYEQEPLVWETWPYGGLTRTHCANKHSTDSAASATSYLTGTKAPFATTGVGPDVELENCETHANSALVPDSIAVWAQDAGMWTGVISTARVTHASPAALYAHSPFREWEWTVPEDKQWNDACKDIASQIVDTAPGNELRVILGGGRKGFLSARSDGRNLLEEWQALPGNRKYIHTLEEFDQFDYDDETEYLLGLFQESHMMYQFDEIIDFTRDQPSIEDMVHMAVKFLSKSPKGFFLFVEGALIDVALHGNEAHLALEEERMFHRTIKETHENTDPNETLLVVTADHTHAWTSNGYPDRHMNILDTFDDKDLDDGLPLPYFVFMTGPAASQHHPESTKRRDLSDVDTMSPHFLNPAFIPTKIGLHGGEDVGVWARGPQSQLFSGSFENNFIPHAIAAALCIGPSARVCDGAAR